MSAACACKCTTIGAYCLHERKNEMRAATSTRAQRRFKLGFDLIEQLMVVLLSAPHLARQSVEVVRLPKNVRVLHFAGLGDEVVLVVDGQLKIIRL